MANIAITNYCNLQCPYCFANKFIDQDKQNITEDQLNQILLFLSKNLADIKHIGIIGGEPTLHPNFSKIIQMILDFSNKYRLFPPTVFSNGIELGQYAHFFDKLHALINLNHPDIIGTTKWNKIEKSLKNLDACGAFENNTIAFGINLYNDIPDWQYIFELSKQYHLTRIRCSLVAPTNLIMYKNKDEYYLQGKEIILKFIQDAKKNNLIVNFDCNHIPQCYYTENELEQIISITDNWHSYCAPVIDITPDMKAISCFGISEPVDIQNFENYTTLKRYFEFAQIYPRLKKNIVGKCENCQKINNFECQGGCLAFAK